MCEREGVCEREGEREMRCERESVCVRGIEGGCENVGGKSRC